MTGSVLAVLRHHLLTQRRAWRGTLIGSLAMPVLFFLSLGLAVGHLVDRGGALDVPYLQYLAPGLIAASAAQVGVQVAAWPVLDGFSWSGFYHVMRATPLRIWHLVVGRLGFVVVRVVIAAGGFLVVAVAFGAVRDPWMVLTLPIAVLVGVAVAAPVLAFSATIQNGDAFSLLFRLIVTPMTLFSGVYFPVDQLPEPIRLVAYPSPLWHGVELCRAIASPAAGGLELAGHIGYLAVWLVAGYLVARRCFAKRLTW